MDSDLQVPHNRSPNHQQHNLLHHQQQQQQMSSGLMRYRSAPSSYFTNILNSVGVDVEDDETIFARLMDSNPQNLSEDQQKSSANETIQSQSMMATMKQEAEFVQNHHQQQQRSNDEYSPVSQIIYQSQTQQLSVPKHNTSETSNPAMDSSYGVPSSMAMGVGNNSNLMRHSSSPAGLFSHINAENGTLMNRMAGMEGKSRGLGESDDGSFNRNSGGYITGFPVGSWDDSAILSDNFLKRLGDENRNQLENQNVEGGNRPPTVLSHHLSLPNSSAELSAILELQDSVPCKIRAKRGFATHPRSIAERVRRTRISERMRKLQELVPNMDKQTNTADMLDLAVDYIKDLQKEVKTLSDNRAKCTCSNQQKREL